MPRSTAQNQIIREATQARLLSSAMTMYGEWGYANTSIRKIADQAGVSLGLLYHYFSSKESLLAAVIENTMMVISDGFVPVHTLSDPQDKILFLLEYIFNALEEDPTYWGLFYSLRSQPAVMRVVGASLRLWTGRLRSLFINFLREAGSETPEIEAFVLYSLVEGTIQQFLLDPENYPLRAVSHRILSTYRTPAP